MHGSRADRLQKLARWKERIGRETVVVPPNLGALWTEIGADTAARLAESKKLLTLEMTSLGRSLNSGTLAAELKQDFGDNWIAEKREIFKVASCKFVQSLSGMVTLFVPHDLERPRNGSEGSAAYYLKVLWTEFKEMDFGDPRVIDQKITSVRLCKVKDKMITSEVFMSASGQNH
jgi:hypothetical protein